MRRNDRRLVYGLGNTDITTVTEDGKYIRSYLIWAAIIQRCVDPKYHAKEPTYIGTTICDEWKNYSAFKAWYDIHFQEEMQIDADLFKKGGKIYSPETCCFLPRQINTALITKSLHNKSGYAGVTWSKQNKKWQTHTRTINGNGHIGFFDDIKLASAAYIEAKQNHIKELAEKYKSLLTKRVYDALMNWRYHESNL